MENNVLQKPSICFVAHFAYGALSGIDTGHIGGIERQQALMARWLAKKGYDISMITWDEGQGDCAVDGIRVYALARLDEGLPGLRFFYPRWTGLAKALKRADADIYHYHCGDLALGQVALWTRRHGKRTIYSVASDPDCDPALPSLKPWRERVLYRYGLQRADVVITQTLRQQKMLQDGFGIHAELIHMPSTGLTKSDKGHNLQRDSKHILWVGRFSQEKRLEWLLDAAEALPHYLFDIVGSANIHTDYAKDLQQRAKSMANVTLHGRVTDDDLSSLYHRSRLLCCTSVFEGFPNTFLEAWSIGLPIVSTFDPDQIIATKNLGKTVQSINELREGIVSLMEDAQRWQDASLAAQNHFNTHHTLDVVMPKLVQLFQ